MTVSRIRIPLSLPAANNLSGIRTLLSFANMLITLALVSLARRPALSNLENLSKSKLATDCDVRDWRS